MNKKKPGSCVVKQKPRVEIVVDDDILEEVYEYGRLLTPGKKWAQIDNRMTMEWQICGGYRHFLKDKKIPTCLKRKTLDTVIGLLSAMTKHREKRIAASQRSMPIVPVNITKKDNIRN